MKNKIDFGMPTLIEIESIQDNINLAKELGLDFVEINMNMPEFQTSNIDAEFLKKCDDVYFTFHLDENFNAFDFNDKVRSAYLETLLETISIAAEIGSPIINMHFPKGVHFKLPGRKIYLFEKYYERFVNSVLEMRAACEDAIGDSKIKICIENTDGFSNYAHEAIELLLESDCFWLTMDIGHDHCAGNIDDEFYVKHDARVAHMHIHDADDNTCHLVLGAGDLDIFKSIEHVKFKLNTTKSIRCVIETKSKKGLRESIEFLRKQNLDYFRISSKI